MYKRQVFTNADNPADLQNAVDMGAEGVGLCRTEHMFFAGDRIKAVREMICSRTKEEREKALAKVEPFQEADFTAMYRIIGTRPLTIRFLDPPLHEFLPTEPKEIEELDVYKRQIAGISSIAPISLLTHMVLTSMVSGRIAAESASISM